MKQVWRGQNSLELAGGVGGGAFARMTMNGDGGDEVGGFGWVFVAM